MGGLPTFHLLYNTPHRVKFYQKVSILRMRHFCNTTPCAFKTLRERNIETLREALTHFNHNRTHAALALGISLRTFRNWIKLYRDDIKDLFSPVPVYCCICESLFNITLDDQEKSPHKIFICSPPCKGKARRECVSVTCSYCESQTEVTKYIYITKTNGRFYCNDDCVKNWNRYGKPLKKVISDKIPLSK